MSYYDDDRGSKRQNGRGGRTKESDYQEASYYSSRGGRDDRDMRQTSLVRRRDESVSSVEEIDRDFAPSSGYVKETTIRKHGTRPIRSRSYSGRDRYDEYDDRSGYTQSRREIEDYDSRKRTIKRSSGRSDRRSHRYDSESSSSPSRSPPRRRERRKSTTEQALGALGLGGVAGALLGKKDDRSRSRDRGGRGRDRGYSSDRYRSRSRRSRSRGGRDRAHSKGKGQEKIIQSLKAAALAGAAEAFRARHEPGGWTGAKGKRVLTAAAGAAGVDGLITNTSSGDPNKHSTRHIIESAIGGLAAGHLVNGPRSQSRGRGRSPSQGRGGAGDLISGGILAAGAKKLYDRARSKSRGRRSESSDSNGSRSPPRREKKRSKSITDYARAALGMGGGAKEVDDRRSRRELNDDEEYYHEKYNGPDGYSDSREVGQPLPSAVNGGAHVRDGYDYGPHHTGDPDTDSSSDLGSSSGEEKERKKGTGKQLLTAGLATIATIHAAHSVWQSAEKHEIRERELRKGEITKAEAKKQRNRGYVKDAASVGIAALGIKGAVSEWMEAKEHREEHKAEKEKFMRHKAKRAARRAKQQAMARYQQSGFSGSMPNLSTTGNGYYDHPPPGAVPYRAAPHMGPVYQDDNPFAATRGPGPLPPADYMQMPSGWQGR